MLEYLYKFHIGRLCQNTLLILVLNSGGRVIVVITGDDNYIHSVEEQTSVLSGWVRRKVSSQFKEEFLDGRKSFVFSWNKEHRPIHEEAMLHFLDPGKNGEIFVREPRVEPTVSEVDPTQVCSELALYTGQINSEYRLFLTQSYACSCICII